jgi:3-methyladenine DNA glycosylase AlkD
MEIIKEIEQFLKDNYDKERALNEKNYMYSDLKHYGVSTWEGRSFFKQYKKPLKDLSKKEVLKLVTKLWNTDVHEKRGFALGILNHRKDLLDITDMPLIEKMMRESQGWGFLDNLIIPIMPVILDKDKKAYSYLKKWIKDDDYWIRRSALLAQILFFRENRGDKKLFFTMAKSQFDETWIDKLYKDKKDLVNDSFAEKNLLKSRAKFFIRKAIGWSLREMVQKDPESAFNFLKENKDKMSGLSFKEGSRKLPDEYKGRL